MNPIQLAQIASQRTNKIQLKKRLEKQSKPKTTQKGSVIKLKDSSKNNSILKYAKMTGNSLLQTRNTMPNKEKDEIDAQLPSNLNLTSLNRTIEKSKQNNTKNTNINNNMNHINKTNIVLFNHSSNSPYYNMIKSNTLSSETNTLTTAKPNKLIGINQIQLKQRSDTFQINKKLNDYLNKEDDNNNDFNDIDKGNGNSNGKSLFAFPEIINHKRNAQIPYEYLNDFLDTFCIEEFTLQFKVIPNFMTKQIEVNNRMRAIVVNWLIEVHNRFKLLPDTLFLSVLLFDRYMSLISIIEKRKLQLIGVTSLLLACKYEEIFSPEIRDFVCILDQTYDKEDLMKQENELMKKMKFEVAYPSSLKYYDILCIELDIKQQYYQYGCYLLELTLLDSRFSKYSQALIASTVSFMVLKFQGRIPQDFFEKIKITLEMIQCCLVDICFLIDNIENSIYQAVIRKYKDIVITIKNKCIKEG